MADLLNIFDTDNNRVPALCTDGLPHDWYETDIGCDLCGDHGGVYCIECQTYIDLIFEDDPRDT